MGNKVIVDEYFDNSSVLCTIPDIRDGFIPQGLTFDERSGYFFITGYMSDGKESPVYAVDGGSGTVKNKVLLLTSDGKSFNGHAGGLSAFKDSLYIAGSTDACMHECPVSEVLAAPYGEKIQASARIDLRNSVDFIRASFTSFDPGLVYAGEFHKSPIFYTHRSHRVQGSGVTQKAYLFGFDVDGDKNAIPKCVYSIPDNVQGACFDGEYVYLSQTRGILSSTILTYSKNDLIQSGTKSVLGEEVPLYILTEKTAHRSTVIPPMSEEIVVVDDEMYIIYEAASNRYKIGKRMGLDKVYRTPVSYFR